MAGKKTTYVHAGPNSRTFREWARVDSKVSAVTNAKRYAAKHGASMILHANGSGRLFYRSGGKVREKLFPRVVVKSFQALRG